MTKKLVYQVPGGDAGWYVYEHDDHYQVTDHGARDIRINWINGSWDNGKRVGILVAEMMFREEPLPKNRVSS